MARTAVFRVMAFGAIGTNVSGMVFVTMFRNLISKIIVAGTASLFPFHAFHAFAAFECMMTGDAWLTHIFTRVKFVVEFYQTIIRDELDLFGQGLQLKPGIFERHPLADMAGVTGDLHFSFFVALDTIVTYKTRVGGIFTLNVARLSEVVA
jgi:hypothetical protein